MGGCDTISQCNFYDSLTEFAESGPLRLHMPGHKGKKLPMPEWDRLAPLDVTELTPTGNLYGGDDWLEDAERLWAWDWNMKTAFFSTEGSTHGIFTLFGLFTRPGDTVLVDRVSHKSIHNALALYDLRPVWLERPWQADCAVTGPLSPEVLEDALRAHPEASAVLVTSPTYYGVLTPLEPLAEVCRRYGAKLLCDGAHGAHLPLVLDGPRNCLLGYNPYACCDGVTVSAHKTLPAPGQTAVIFANGVRCEALRQASALTGTTSPSFVLLAALDRLRAWMWEGREDYRKTARLCAELRQNYPCLPMTGLDPCRVTFQVPDGERLGRELEARGIYTELQDSGHVVAIFTAADTQADFDRLTAALDELGLRGCPPAVLSLGAPPAPDVVCPPRAAVFAPKVSLPLGQAAGRICGECIAPYPPGVPVAAPGERLTEKTMEYLYLLCYNDRSAVLTLEE